MSQTSIHLKLVSWIRQWVHCAHVHLGMGNSGMLPALLQNIKALLNVKLGPTRQNWLALRILIQSPVKFSNDRNNTIPPTFLASFRGRVTFWKQQLNIPRPYVQLLYREQLLIQNRPTANGINKGIMWRAGNVLNSEEKNLFRVTATNCQPDLSLSNTITTDSSPPPPDLCSCFFMHLSPASSDTFRLHFSFLFTAFIALSPNILFRFPLPSTPYFLSLHPFLPLSLTHKLVNMLSVTSWDLI